MANFIYIIDLKRKSGFIGGPSDANDALATSLDTECKQLSSSLWSKSPQSAKNSDNKEQPPQWIGENENFIFNLYGNDSVVIRSFC